MNNAAHMYLLGCHQWEPVRQVEPHLVSEHTGSAGARPIAFEAAMVKDMPEQIMVLLHACKVQNPRPARAGYRCQPAGLGITREFGIIAPQETTDGDI
jgi:hypothetical protein